MSDLTRPRENWGTRIGVILAVTGSAVGLGNFLRFPGLAAQYEGGAFMIPYFVAFFLLGLPIAWVEWSMGRYGGRHRFNSSPGIFRIVSRKDGFAYAGALGLLIPVAIYMFYVFVEAWCLGFAWKYLIGDPVLLGQATRELTAAQAGGGETVTLDSSNYVLHFVGAFADGSTYSRLLSTDSALLFMLICFVLNFVLIYRGLNKGIEWFCQFAMPALVICALIVLVRVLTLPTVTDEAGTQRTVLGGLGYMWNPGSAEKGLLESLANADIWLAAAGQIFFSLSVGFGIIITYSSYMRADDDVALSGLTAAAGNSWCEVALGGLILIPAAFLFLGPLEKDTLDSSFQLGFMVLPQVFEQMPAGRWFGFIFFFLLFLAAVTSSLSMLQPAIAFLEEGLGLGRKASVALLGFITLVGAAFVTFFSADLIALDALDFWVATFGIFTLATIQVILYGWVMGVDKGFEELDQGASIRVPRPVKVLIKYISPLFLLTVFAFWAVQKLPGRALGLFGYKFAADADVEAGAADNAGQIIAHYRTATPRDVSDGLAQRVGELIPAYDGTELLTVGFVGVIVVLFVLLIAQAIKRWRDLDARNDAAHHTAKEAQA